MHGAYAVYFYHFPLLYACSQAAPRYNDFQWVGCPNPWVMSQFAFFAQIYQRAQRQTETLPTWQIFL